MDFDIYDKLELHEKFVYLASQPEVSAQAGMLMSLLLRMTEDEHRNAEIEWSNTNGKGRTQELRKVEMNALKQAYRKVAFHVVEHLENTRMAERTLKSQKGHTDALREIGQESNIEVVIK